jgi:hypothetical protein
MERKPMPVPPPMIAGATLVILLIVVTTVWQNTLHRPDIRGTWTSVGCEQTPGDQDRTLGLKRTYELTGGEWKTRIDYFAEGTCEHPTFSFETKGSYELGDKSEEVAGATHGEFIIKSIALTPHIPEVAQVFEQSRCGDTQWEVGMTTEVGDSGCLGVAPKISDCPAIFNIVKRENDLVYFADNVEGQGLCKRGEWPKELNSNALKKI